MKQLLHNVFALLLTSCAIQTVAQIPNYVPNQVTALGPVALTSAQLPSFTVTAPTGCGNNNGSVRITWNFGSGTRVRAWDMHGGLRFDNTQASGTNSLLNSGNSFTHTIANLTPGIYTFAVYRDPFDDNVTTNNAAGGNVDDFSFGGWNSPTGDQLRAGVYSVVLLPTANNITTLTATAAAATNCLTNNGSITINGLSSSANYEFSVLADATSFPLSETGSGTSFTISNLYPGIYPVRIRVQGQTCFRLINVEVPVTGGVACYSDNITCNYSLGSNMIANANFGTSAATLPTNGSTDYTLVPFSTGDPGDSRYAMVRSSFLTDNALTGNNNWLLRNFDYTGRNTHLWGTMQASRDHTGSTTAADGSLNGFFMMVNANYRQDRVLTVSNINLQACQEYEFSVWVKNMQPYFSRNKNNSADPNQTYQPIIPRLGLVVNGIIYDFQNLSANLQPADIQTRTRINDQGWQRVGVRFKAPATVANSTVTVYNFQQGGYGNDFAIDDLLLAPVTNPIFLSGTSVGSCGPTRTVLSTASSTCSQFGTPVYQWQISTDNGASYSNVGSTFTTLPGTTSATNTSANIRYRIQITDGSCVTVTPHYAFNNNGGFCVLPDERVQLRGEAGSTGNRVDWSTAGINGIRQFQLERSFDGATFELVTTVAATNATAYSFTDGSTAGRVTYYRVRLVYDDGKTQVSAILKLQQKQTGAQLKTELYPNPVRSVAYLQVEAAAAGLSSITVYDAAGRSMMQQQVAVQKGNNVLPLTGFKNLAPGSYTVEVLLNGEKTVIRAYVMQ